MTSTTIELPDDVLAQVRDLAQMTNRRIEEVLAEAVTQGLAYDRWFRAEVEKGIRSAEQGPLIPAEIVWADLLKRGLLTPEAIAQADAEATSDDAREGGDRERPLPIREPQLGDAGVRSQRAQRLERAVGAERITIDVDIDVAPDHQSEHKAAHWLWLSHATQECPQVEVVEDAGRRGV
jgi:predicted transcriptional regulator